MPNPQPKRHLRLPSHGTLLINTDLHGNGDDFRRLEQIFQQQRQRDPHTHWAILGDIVHAPDPLTAQQYPELYDYIDESAWIVERICLLQRQLPQHVHFVLGNHDYAHIGGQITRKFYQDEAAHLEATMTPTQISQMHTLFQNALLSISAPCGVLLAHGSPDTHLQTLDQLNDIPLPHNPHDPTQDAIVQSLLWSYGQPAETTTQLLNQLSTHLPTHQPLRVVIHGHDRDESGWFVEGDNQLCPVIFGAPKHNKHYMMLNLALIYSSLKHLLRHSPPTPLHPQKIETPPII